MRFPNKRRTPNTFTDEIILLQAPRGPTTHEIMLPIWPLEDRPELYQNEDYINEFSVETCLALKAAWESQLKKENRGENTFGTSFSLYVGRIGPVHCKRREILAQESMRHNFLLA